MPNGFDFDPSIPGGDTNPGTPAEHIEGDTSEETTLSVQPIYQTRGALKLITIVSRDAPRVKNALWIKPVEGGFAIYAKFNGKWQPLQLIDDGGTAPINDDEVPELATVGDYELAEATDDTIAGAKKYADGIGEALTGTSDDTYEDLTLNGLKKYIDKQIEDLE